MIKTLLFDNNGVLTTNDNEGTYQNLATFFGVSTQDLRPKQDSIAVDLDKGKITTDEFYELMQKQMGVNKDLTEIRKVHLGSYKSKVAVKDYVKTLKGRYELALLTNFGDAFDDANQSWKLEEIFEPNKIFVSCKVGMIKPHNDFFDFALAKLKKQPEEVAFIDDKEENVEAARRMGMKGILFRSIEELKKDIELLEEE